MATIKISTSKRLGNVRMWDKLMDYADRHNEDKTLLFLVSLIAQGVLFLPVPAILMYYYGAPVIVLIVTLGLFFANVIAGMGGSGMRTLVSLFVLSVMVHVFMLALFIL